MTYKRKDQIKELLYSYADNRRKAAEIERAIIEGTPGKTVAVMTGPGDPTGSRAIQLAMNTELAELRWKIKVVDRFIEHIAGLPTERRQQEIDIIRYIYTEKRSLAQTAARIGVTERWLRDRNQAMLRILEGISIAFQENTVT